MAECSTAYASDVASLVARALWLLRILAVAVLCNGFWILRFVSHISSQGGLPFKHWPNFKGESHTVLRYARPPRERPT